MSRGHRPNAPTNLCCSSSRISLKWEISGCGMAGLSHVPGSPPLTLPPPISVPCPHRWLGQVTVTPLFIDS
jgi:hypothetical protein